MKKKYNPKPDSKLTPQDIWRKNYITAGNVVKTLRGELLLMNLTDPKLTPKKLAFLNHAIIKNIEFLQIMNKADEYGIKLLEEKIECLEEILDWAIESELDNWSIIYKFAQMLYALSPTNHSVLERLGDYHFNNCEFKKAASYYEQLPTALGKFQYYYATGRQLAQLNPKQLEKAQENYQLAESMLPSLPKSSVSPKMLEIFYICWVADVCVSIEDRREVLRKGAALGLIECQASYAEALEKAGEIKEALNWYRKAADQGNLNARFLMILLEEKYLDETDSTEITKRLQVIADRHPPAQLFLGARYLGGIGVEQNHKMAIEILTPLTLHENKSQIAIPATALLGLAFLDLGEITTAVKHFQVAASHQELTALINLAFLYRTGIGVSIDDRIAERYLIQAASQSVYCQHFLLNFYTIQSEMDLCSESEVQQKIKELPKIENERVISECLYKFPQSKTILSQQFSENKQEIKQQGDKALNGKFQALIREITTDRNLYTDQKIRALFANIYYVKNCLDNSTLPPLLFNIGKLFDKLSHIVIHLLVRYVSEIQSLLRKLAEKVILFTPTQNALALDGMSKLHLDPTDDVLHHCLELLLKNAQQQIHLFNVKDLSMSLSALIRLGAPLDTFRPYFKTFFESIQNQWIKFNDLSSLIHLARMLAVLDVKQSQQKTRLISMRFLEQLFSRIAVQLESSESKKLAATDANKLGLSLAYFSGNYPYSQTTLPSMHQIMAIFEEPTVPPGRNSLLHAEVQGCLAEILEVDESKVPTEVVINGLRVDNVIRGNIVVSSNGPHHYRYKFIDTERGQVLELTYTPNHDYHNAIISLDKGNYYIKEFCF